MAEMAAVVVETASGSSPGTARRRWVVGLRARRALVVGLTLALLATLLPAPADALDVSTSDTRRLLGDSSIARLNIRLDDGTRVRGDMIRFRSDDPDLELRPRLAGGVAAGITRMSAFASTESNRGGIAGVNGGYWLNRPTGVPNGLYVERGRMAAADSVSESNLPARRAIAGFAADGRLVADRILVRLDLDVPHQGRTDVAFDDFNRTGGSLSVFDARYGAGVNVPAGATLLVVDDLAIASTGRATGIVRDRRKPTNGLTWRVEAGTTVLLAAGSRAEVLDGIQAGDKVGITSSIVPDATDPGSWAGLQSALPGGGLLIRNGRISSGTEMRSEGLNHAGTRRARTGVGQTADGRTMLITIDETGGSGGLTLFQFAQVMNELGAVNAVALDGGGSTSMVVGRWQRNRPSHPDRGHSSALFLYGEPPPPARGLEGACPSGAVPAGGFGDTASTVHREAIDCLAWWGVTGGVTPTTYVPANGVTRAQMASFLARWIDDVADRGSGRVLAADASLPFTDVRADNVHADAIARLATVGVVNGRTATTFDPDRAVTRAETASLLRRAIEYATTEPLPAARDTFLDDNDLVHEASIDQLAALGVITGTGNMAFEPNIAVSRGAMASLVMRASDLLVEQERVTAPR